MNYSLSDDAPIKIADDFISGGTFYLGETFYISSGEKFNISDVTEITVNSGSSSFNFLPTGADIYVLINNVRGTSLLKNGSVFRSPKHKRIEFAGHYIDRSTILERFNILLAKLRRKGSLKIEVLDEPDVIITSDGRIMQGRTELLIDKIKSDGGYRIGLEGLALNRLSYESDPNQVVIADSVKNNVYVSGSIGGPKKFHSRANVIHFSPTSNTTAYHALLRHLLE